MKRTTLRAISIDTKEWKAKGEQYLKQADNISKRKATHNDRHEHIRFDSQQAHTLSLLAEIRFTLLAADAFRIAGEQCWYDSARALSHAAALSGDAKHDSKMAASLFTEAGAMAEKLGFCFANDNYKQAVSQYCNVLDFKSAAMLLERMANNFLKKDDFSASLQEFQRASKLYSAAGEINDADRTLERAAYLLGRTGDLIESSNSYNGLAMSQARRNTTIFNVPRYALRSIILQLSSKSDFSEVQDLIEEFCQEDCRVEESRELAFIYDVLQCISSSDLDKFADCVYAYNEIDELDDLMLESLEGLMKIVMQKEDKGKR
jgi:tetratricopeptide (TPR) repeat protein